MAMRRGALGAAFLVTLFAGCSLVDSVSDYAGPPEKTADAATVDVIGEPCASDPECDDKNRCTSDQCKNGSCVHVIRDGESCTDGDLCNGDEVCDGNGICVHGIPPEVEDDDLCTVDTCDSTLGVKHEPVHFEPLQFCSTGTCPADYFARAFICSEACPPSPFGVNGVICERICKSEIQVCCGDCTATTCPPGYVSAGLQSATCVCGTGGSLLTCKR